MKKFKKFNSIGREELNIATKIIKSGKLSADKWELSLNINFAGKTKINSKYNVITDFTPFLNIPLMNGDPSRYEAIFNEAITKIDEFLNKLK